MNTEEIREKALKDTWAALKAEQRNKGQEGLAGETVTAIQFLLRHIVDLRLEFEEFKNKNTAPVVLFDKFNGRTYGKKGYIYKNYLSGQCILAFHEDNTPEVFERDGRVHGKLLDENGDLVPNVPFVFCQRSALILIAEVQ